MFKDLIAALDKLVKNWKPNFLKVFKIASSDTAK